MSEHTYQAVVKSVISAVDADNKTKDKWVTAGVSVRLFYPNREAVEAVKAQFTADCIMPALPKHAAALAVDLPRKGSKEYNELSDANKLKWDNANQAKKDARAIAATYFVRVLDYAFPKEKTDSANPPKTLKTKLIETITDCIGKIEKAEAPEFDAPAALTELRKALSIIAK
jgi:hypothetical protein